MENLKAQAQAQAQTLMQAYGKFLEVELALDKTAALTELLNQKLKRTEGHSSCDEVESIKNPIDPQRNIVELFNSVCDRMVYKINDIGDSIEQSMKMID